MEPNQDRSLIPLPSHELTAPNLGKNRIVGEMVAGSVGLAKAVRMESLRAQSLVCVKCPHLVKSRTQVVFGVGNINAKLMFVGEAPSARDDLLGEPFADQFSGQFLTETIEAMGFTRDEVYITSILKCRTDMPSSEPGQRSPRPDEMARCLPYLIEQITIIQPRVIVSLGLTAMEFLTGKESPKGRGMLDSHGKWQEFRGIPLMPAFHPAFLLRQGQSNDYQRAGWEDMLLVLERLGKPITEKQRGLFFRRAKAPKV